MSKMEKSQKKSEERTLEFFEQPLCKFFQVEDNGDIWIGEFVMADNEEEYKEAESFLNLWKKFVSKKFKDREAVSNGVFYRTNQSSLNLFPKAVGMKIQFIKK